MFILYSAFQSTQGRLSIFIHRLNELMNNRWTESLIKHTISWVKLISGHKQEYKSQRN